MDRWEAIYWSTFGWRGRGEDGWYLDSVSRVREPLDSLGYQQGHFPCSSSPDGVHKYLMVRG